MGFSFFGKNLYNSIPFLIGTYLYSKYSDTPIANLLFGALFSSALSPVVSLITFGQGLPIFLGMPIGIMGENYCLKPTQFQPVTIPSGFTYIYWFHCWRYWFSDCIDYVFEFSTHDIEPQQLSVRRLLGSLSSFHSCFLIRFILNDYSFRV